MWNIITLRVSKISNCIIYNVYSVKLLLYRLLTYTDYKLFSDDKQNLEGLTVPY